MKILSHKPSLAFIRCYLCDSLIDRADTICEHCLSQVLSSPTHLAWEDILFRPDAQRMLKLSNINQLYCFDEYQAPFDFLIPQVKYQANPVAKACLKKLILSQNVDFSAYDYLAPVPLHWWRYYMRGFNQAHWLANLLQRLTQLPVLNSTKRVRYTRQQAKLNAKQRAYNLSQAFVVKNVSTITGRRILIVDDVVTTGATLQAFSQILLNAGAAQVSAACVCWARLD
ncbi:ComF family protein [Catenovulum adriaticum]|uniref:Phosphoribosyltransferase family protein n=1 Tax=Catenovulum adriaticum TaxID=2984846 RepID=A0ABY7ALA2_9ALTE|nr:phosphoribosyltransferase family protein [Catenovulum sp. TS8]WAJ70013.1 phosphoribosyltransferase family protein [Catenovulum sp. TS8]